MPEVRKIFLQQTVGEALRLPYDEQCDLVARARGLLEADGYRLQRESVPQGREIEVLYLKMSDPESGGLEGMATIRYNIAADRPEDRAIIALAEVAGAERRVERRVLSLAAFVQEKAAAADKPSLASDAERKPSP